ncbi:ORC1-type DNA replication protein [Natronobacterium gregoryi]|uniref:ORC1-type DNA replication protein n=2 Tax=Natronobacterium gregoryi TaxID=44930 RepID=L0AFM6_NATGS|nr:ORC1-type DNA replication protein [Natronobacterium gregoryi]AFZ72708.1 orc1/cdc6 family replication initiation protein [Natronobacterium gregoryi SP2]ELY68997.1 cell division control protein 6 [Natronobacterium gregoryi SP2]PLK20660.1 cell division control protein 6 [Natronobacterium gregoryi SP2]SFI92138.1 cell division control protein 6 [Natronobacterium gregoryi]
MADDPDEGMLSWDESVFRDEHVFEIDYVPETFKHREGQMETLTYALRPAVRGSRPLNVVVRGPPGTGKTTAIQKLFDEVGAQTSDVWTIQVNCQVNSTRYSVFSRLFEGTFDYEPPSSGISFKKLFRQIAEKLVEEDRTLVVALDDVNYLFYENEASDALYSLLRAHEEHPGAKIGVIVVSSDPALDVIDELDSRVQSVFRPEDVYFPVYDAPEIVDILDERIRRGFNDGVIARDTLEYVAELTGESGDLRVGIDLLRRAGLNAEMRASRTVEREDVEDAYETSKYVNLSRHLSGLTDNERALLEVIAHNDGDQAGDVYDAFHERTDLGYTRYSEIVNKLDQLGLIDAEYTDVDGRGRSRSLSLSYDRDAVLERLE